MFDISQFLMDINTKGHYVIECPEIDNVLKGFSFDNLKHGDATYKTADPQERIESLNPQHRRAVEALIEFISENIFKGIKHDIFFNDIWQGVADNVKDFHNDFDPYTPQHTTSLNIYLDDSSVETGGMLQFACCGTIASETVYPKKNQIIILNQREEWTHKVTSCSSVRRMISFKLALADLMPNLNRY